MTGTIRGIRGSAAAVMLGVGVAACGIFGPDGLSCAPLVAGTLVESAQFTPYEDRHSHLPEVALNGTGGRMPAILADSLVPSNVLDDLPLRWAAVGVKGTLYRYFLAGEIGREMTYPEFLADGGIVLSREPGQGAPIVAVVLNQLGDRGVAVDVGQYPGALSWGDPESNGVRAHQILWSDGAFNYTLIADRTAEETVNLARGMVCG